MIGPLALGAASSSTLADLDLKGKLSKEQLKALLQDMDSSVRALPATAQVRWAGKVLPCIVLHKRAVPQKACLSAAALVLRSAGHLLQQTGRPSVTQRVCEGTAQVLKPLRNHQVHV